MAIDYGIDLAGVLDLDANLTVVRGPLAVAHALARRLTTPAGGLFYAPTYGYDLRRFLNEVSLPPGAVASGVETEALKDERVLSASAAVTLINETLTATLQFETADGPFELTLTVSALSIDLFTRRL